MTSHLTSLDELQLYLHTAKQNLSAEKAAIIGSFPLSAGFNREEYAFAYLRAERLGMGAINARLASIDWLPMQLDVKAEALPDSRATMKLWLQLEEAAAPGAVDFGNDFIHALARCGTLHGWIDSASARLAERIATLFFDLSCLIGLAYYTGWLAEQGITHMPLSAPGNLTAMLQDIGELLQSQDFAQTLQARNRAQRKPERKAPPKVAARKKPALRLIANHDLLPATPELLPV